MNLLAATKLRLPLVAPVPRIRPEINRRRELVAITTLDFSASYRDAIGVELVATRLTSIMLRYMTESSINAIEGLEECKNVRFFVAGKSEEGVVCSYAW